MISVKKKENETSTSLIFRFTKKLKRSGVLRESRKRRYHARPKNKIKRKLAAIYRTKKQQEVEKAKKLGLL